MTLLAWIRYEMQLSFFVYMGLGDGIVAESIGMQMVHSFKEACWVVVSMVVVVVGEGSDGVTHSSSM